MANPWEENYSDTSVAPWEVTYATPEVPLSDKLKRQAGLTARYGLEGAGSIIDLLQTPIRGAMNLALPKEKQLTPVSAGGSLADLLGLPQPKNATERVVGDISRTIAGTGTTMGLAGLTSPTSTVGNLVKESLVSNPQTQLAGAVGAGGAGGLTREGGGGELAQLSASLAGGFAGGSMFSPKAIKMSTEQLQNIPKDKILSEAQKAGFIALPSDVKAGGGAKALETMSGKFKSEELASSKNQNTANNLTRKYLGLQESTPLNSDTFDALREQFAAPYREASQLPSGQVNKPTIQMATGQTTTKPIFKSGAQLVDEIKTARDESRANWKSFNSGMASEPTKARKAAIEADKKVTELENQLDTLAANNNQPDLLASLGEARRNIAKVHTVEKAMVGENLIDYRKIGKMIDKGVPVTGELALVGKFAKEFPRVNKPVAYEPTAFTLPDVFASAVGLGVDALTGVPLTSGLPAARVGSRYLMESAPFQSRFVKPQYKKITTPYVPYMGLLNTSENQ